MSLLDIFNSISAGGIVATVVILMTVIQIVPCKLDPWTWLGNQLNKDMRSEIDSTNKRVSEINVKLNNHMAESYRTSILDFADSILHGKMFAHDKWRQMLKVCAAYEQMIKTEGLINGDATEAIEYIRKQYQDRLEHNIFAEFS